MSNVWVGWIWWLGRIVYVFQRLVPLSVYCYFSLTINDVIVTMHSYTTHLVFMSPNTCTIAYFTFDCLLANVISANFVNLSQTNNLKPAVGYYINQQMA